MSSDAGHGEIPKHEAAAIRVIKPPPDSPAQIFLHAISEYWRRRAALGYFSRRFMQKRYGRTFLGYLWFVIPYVLPLLLGALVFGGIIGVSTGSTPYFLYFLIALGTWLLFSQTTYFSIRSLEITRSDIRRLYVPRLLPLTAAITLPMIALVVYAVMLACALSYYMIARGTFYLVIAPSTLLVLPAFAMLIVLAWACGMWWAPLAPRARDVRRLAGYVLGVWYFLTPIMYPLSQIPSDWRFLASLNPITAPIEMVKIGLIDYGEVTTLGLISYTVGLLIAAIGGFTVFLTRERRDVDFY